MTSIFRSKPGRLLGGEFCLGYQDFLGEAHEDAIPCYRQDNTLCLDTGRAAIFVALKTILGLGGKKEAWLPRYCCESVLLPFSQLGFQLKFYSWEKT